MFSIKRVYYLLPPLFYWLPMLSFIIPILTLNTCSCSPLPAKLTGYHAFRYKWICLALKIEIFPCYSFHLEWPTHLWSLPGLLMNSNSLYLTIGSALVCLLLAAHPFPSFTDAVPKPSNKLIYTQFPVVHKFYWVWIKHTEHARQPKSQSNTAHTYILLQYI